MPGMPAPMQPMGGLPPMMPMGGPSTFPAAPLPAGQTFTPPPMPPMPLAGFPPPPVRPPMAQPPMPQKGSNAPRRKRFGDSLEGMLGRNMFAPQQQRPLPMPPQMMQQRMVAPRTPMMRTPTPRPMNQGGIVQGFAPGGVVQAIMDNYGYSEAEAQAMYDSATSNVSNLIDPGIVKAYEDSLAAVQEDIAKRQANTIPDAVAGGILTEEQAQAAIDASKANILAKMEALQAAGDSPFVDVVPQEGGIDPTSSEVIDATGGIFGEEPYTTHYGVNRPAYMDALAAAKAALAAPPAPEPEAAAPAPAPAPAPEAAPAPQPAPVPEPAPTPSIPGADAGPGTAVGAPANFGTGVYAPAPVDPSEVNPIDYTQFTGDVGNFSGTSESSALFGPKINIPQSVSQYYTSPITGKLTTTAGPEMVATSPIGVIKLPPRPVDIDIFDFLSTPTYGSLLGNEAEEMAMGGVVQGFANGGNANQQAAASMLAAGIGNVGGKAITSEAQDIQDRFSGLANRRSRRRRKRRERRAREEAARLAAEQAAAEAAALAALPTGGPGTFPPAAPPPTDITPEVFIPEVNPASAFASNLMNIEQPDRSIDAEIAGPSLAFDDDPAFTGALPPVSIKAPDDPFTYDIGAIGLGDNRDDTQANLGAGVDVDQSGVGLPSGLASPQDFDAGLGFGSSDYPDMSMTAIPGVTTPTGTQIAPEAATTFGITPEEQGIMSGMSAVPGAGSAVTPEELSIIGGMSSVPTAGSAVTPEELNIISGMSAVPSAGQKITSPKTSTGIDPQADQYRSSVNAAEAAFLQEALGQMEFDDDGNLVGAEPNFIEQVIGKIIRNLTLGMFDPNDPQKREDAKAILDAYQKTGKFIYDGKEMSIDELIEASKGAGIEPAVIGVEGPDEKIVGFTDGTGFRNIMGDFDYKKGIGSDTQNILTGSTNVFGGGDTTTNITTGGGDPGGGSDTTDDVDLGHTVDEDGNIICNTEGYIYNPETKICELPKEEDTGSDSPKINIGTAPVESFDDVLARITTAAPNIAPISANVRPMQEGGMAGLNRAADNFLQALVG